MNPILGSVLGGIISGGASLLGGQQSNAANAQQAMMNNLYNAQAQSNQNIVNAQQADLSRQFAAQMMGQSEQFNAQQAGAQMQFQNQEMQSAMNYNTEQAAVQRNYETQMSSTAYQRAVADMKAAGLNPILSAGTGGASTPSVASPTISAPAGASGSVGIPGSAQASGSALGGTAARMSDVVSPAVYNALQGSKLFNDLRQSSAGVDQTQAQTRLVNQNVDVANSQADINNQTVSNLRATYDNIMAQKRQIDAQTSDAQQSARLKDAQVNQTNRSTETMGGDVGGFGFRINPFAWWPPSGTSFSPGNPGTTVVPAPTPPVVPASPGPNSDKVWGEGGNKSHSWAVLPDGSKGPQLW